jgi:hypothetical protein
MNEKYYGNYIGIVISNPALDPEGRNRAQVWVPSITNTLYEGWNNNTIDKSKKITEEMLNRLRNSLPWAECASPLIGGGAPFFANSATGISSSNPEDTVTDDGGLDTEPEPDSVPAGDLAADFSIPLRDVPVFESGTEGSEEDLPPVEPELPDFEDRSALVPTSPTGSDQTGEPIAPAKTEPNPQIVNFEELKSFAKSTIRGRCINDGTTGNCLQGASVWAYTLTKNEKLNRPTNGSAVDIRLGNNTFFQDSGSYQDNKSFPSNYQPQIGDQVLGKNHIITFLGRDYNGKELWYSDFTDKSPSRYIDENGWNPDEMVLIRLKNAPNEVDLASFDESTPSQPDDFRDGNSAAPYGGAGTATGTFSTISHLAKVWVFFYGGDIQRPIYFAQVTDPSSISQELQNDPSRIDTLFA